MATIPATVSSVVSATNPLAANSPSSATGVDSKTIAGNFQTFLQLLTTQLRNQNPLDPLDTNQFTQQLVQFAQVEQQLKSNDQLTALVALQKTAQGTQALNFVGQMVSVDGATAPLTERSATWFLSSAKPATAAINIKSATGQTVFSGAYSISAGSGQPFIWDGKDASGLQWPDGNYTMSITAQDASGLTVAIATEIQGRVDSADLTQSPPVLSIAGHNYTLDKLKRVLRD